MLDRSIFNRRSAATTFALAGAAATLTGCSSIFGTRADVVDPVTGGPFVAEQGPVAFDANASNRTNTPAPAVNSAFNQPATTTVATNAQPPRTNTQANQTNSQNNPQNNPGSRSWLAFSEAADAERPAPASQEPPISNAPDGPNMAARLYGDILETPIPSTGDAIGQHTTNIQQISFANDGSDFDPQVSRDGLYLVYASTQHRPQADIYLQEIGSRVITRITDDPAGDVMPNLNAQGDRLAFASNRTGNWDIWVMPTTGNGRAIQITNDPAHELHPSFSPDGSKVVYCRLGPTSGRWELWVADSFGDTGAQFIGYGLFPEWCPVPGTGNDGADRILFQRSRERGSRTFSVWTIDYDRNRRQAGRETQIASDPETALINPSWSPDGSRIVYSAVPNPDQWTGSGRNSLPPSASIYMTGVDGRGTVELTRGNAIDMMPAWSVTGRVFFVSNRSGVENLWSLDIAPAILAATGVDPWNDIASINNPANQRAQQQNNRPGNPGTFGPGFTGFVSAPTDE